MRRKQRSCGGHRNSLSHRSDDSLYVAVCHFTNDTGKFQARGFLESKSRDACPYDFSENLFIECLHLPTKGRIHKMLGVGQPSSWQPSFMFYQEMSVPFKAGTATPSTYHTCISVFLSASTKSKSESYIGRIVSYFPSK